ncbi:MAG: hypothetical protein NTZ21_13060 [Actinobacteria bacterium]|nr:hypothetical protein [Actinomycetota bacterium]
MTTRRQQAPETLRAGSGGAEEWAAAVVKRLPDVPTDERADIERDLVDRFGADSPSLAEMHRRHGDPVRYADEMREGMQLEPFPPRVIRRRRRVLVAAATVSVAGVVGWWWSNGVPDPYPARIAPWTFDQDPTAPGAVDEVGSVLRVQVADGATTSITFTIENLGDDTIRIDGMLPAVGFRAEGGSYTFGPELPPVWIVELGAIADDDDPSTLGGDPMISRFDASDRWQVMPLIISPGETGIVAMQATIQYCQSSPGAITDRIRFEATIDGERRELDGPELSFDLSGCP